MRKTYIKPVSHILRISGETVLAASGVNGKIGNSVEIGYGGVDDDGILDPEVKGNPFGDSVFD